MSLALLFGQVLGGVRTLIGVAFLLGLVVAGTHWFVREGKLAPFGGWASFVRRWSDPLLAPIERRLRAAGGNPQHAPWWLLGIIVVGGLLLLQLLQFVFGMVLQLQAAARGGPRGVLYVAFDLTFSLLMFALLIRVFSSWFGLTRYTRGISLTYRLTDWLVEPIRRMMPPMGMFDFSPLVAYLVLIVLRSILMGAIF